VAHVLAVAALEVGHPVAFLVLMKADDPAAKAAHSHLHMVDLGPIVRSRGLCDKAPMLDYRLDTSRSILYLHPTSALQKEDFAKLAKSVDPHIEKRGDLAGIVLDLKVFPGWENLGAMAAHLKFVREHHQKVKRIAIVTDAKIGMLGEKLASHFVAATIKHFPAGEVGAAEKWVGEL